MNIKIKNIRDLENLKMDLLCDSHLCEVFDYDESMNENKQLVYLEYMQALNLFDQAATTLRMAFIKAKKLKAIDCEVVA